MTAYTLFRQSGGSTVSPDSTAYTMGVEFSASADGCTLAAIWFYSASGAFALPETIALYQVSGQSLVHSELASWSGAIGSGWVRAAFASPPALTSGTNYKACILENSGNFFYSATPHYWDTGAGANGISNGPLSAPSNANADGGQDTFNAASVLAYPAGSFNASNYWIDPEISAPAPPPSGPVKGSSSAAVTEAARTAAGAGENAGSVAGVSQTASSLAVVS